MVAERATSAAPQQHDATAIRLFAGPLHVPDRRRQDLEALLSLDERARARRLLLDRDRRRFAVARARLRMILGGILDVAPEALRFTVEPGGKPRLATQEDEHAQGLGADIAFSLSHTAEIVLVAVGCGVRIGVDIERVDAALDTRALEHTCLTPSERAWLAGLGSVERGRAFLQSWTRKEAYLKGIGAGLAVPLQTVSIEPRPGRPRTASVVAPGAASGWVVHDLAVPPGYVAALALDAVRPVSACRWIDD